MTATLIDGKAIAARMREAARQEALRLGAEGWKPMLVSVSVGDVAAAELYVRTQKKQAELAGMGKPGRVTGETVKPGAALIDIGFNRVDGRILGDANFESCTEVAGWITPVSGRVGPVTVAILMKNAVLAARMQMEHYRTAYATAV